MRSLVEQLAGALSQAHSDIRDAQSRLEVIFDHATDGIFVLSGNSFTVEAANPAVGGMLGVPSSQLLNMPIAGFVSPASALEREGVEGSGDRGWLATVATSGDFTEGLGHRADGSTFPAELVVRTARVGGRAILVGTLRDVSQWKHLIGERTAEIGRLAT